MGLDNIPAIYPCKKQGLAVLDSDQHIDCKATIDKGNCPLHNAKNNDPLIKDTIIPLGIMATDCWYRGKYGTYLLEQMANFNIDFPISSDALYGHEIGILTETESGSPSLDSDECIELSKIISAFTESWVHYVKTRSEATGDKDKEQSLINDWVYLAWWLKFVGEECDGMVAWY